MRYKYSCSLCNVKKSYFKYRLFSDTVAEKYGVTALECALRFLNQKPIDLDLTKEQVVPVIDEDARYSGYKSVNKFIENKGDIFIFLK